MRVLTNQSREWFREAYEVRLQLRPFAHRTELFHAEEIAEVEAFHALDRHGCRGPEVELLDGVSLL